MAEAPRPGSPDPADGPPAALPDGDTLRELIMTKEKELHDINEYRIQTLESLLAEKERDANEAKQRMSKLKDDFTYNLRLLEERDAELERYDASFTHMKAVLRDRDVEISELKIASAELTLSEIESGVSGKRTIRLEGDDGPIPHFNFGWSVLAEKEERQKTKIGAFSTVTGIGARKPGRTGPQGQAPPNVKVSPKKGKFRAYG